MADQELTIIKSEPLPELTVADEPYKAPLDRFGRPIDPDAVPSPLLERLSHMAHPEYLGDFLGLVLPSGIPPLAQMLPASASRAILTGTRGVGAVVSAGVRGAVRAGGAVADVVSPDIAGIVSPRGGHLLRVVQKMRDAAAEAQTAAPNVAAQPAAAVSHAPTFAQQVRTEAARTPPVATTPTFAQQVRTEAARTAQTAPTAAVPPGDVSFANRVRAQAAAPQPVVPPTPSAAQARMMASHGRTTPFSSEGGPGGTGALGRPAPVPLSVAAKEVKAAASEAKLKLTAREYNEAIRYAKLHPTENVIEGVLAHRELREQLKASPSFASLPTDAEMQASLAKDAVKAKARSTNPRYGAYQGDYGREEATASGNPFR